MGGLVGGEHCPGRHCLRSNIAARYGSEDYFDIILTDAGTLPDETKEFQNKRTVVAVRRSECVDAECGASLQAHAPSIVLLPNPFEVLYTPSLMDVSKLGLVVHMPPAGPSMDSGAASAVIGPEAEAGRPVDVLLVTRPSLGDRYPLQPRWEEAVAGKKTRLSLLRCHCILKMHHSTKTGSGQT
eukprot:COSAG06_NODE_5441_length_3481_cov_2.764932_4_plen_184_part_00